MEMVIAPERKSLTVVINKVNKQRHTIMKYTPLVAKDKEN